jgi:hypothetical protein
MSLLNLKHGECCRVAKGKKKSSPEYKSWSGIHDRCLNSNDKHYHRYGGRGIKIADVWVNDFEAFRAYVGFRPAPGYTIDRIDNDGNYEPGNVRWATGKEQARNRSSNRLIEFNGSKMPLAQACEQAGISVKTVRKRIKGGWGIMRSLAAPVDQKKVDAAKRNPRKSGKSSGQGKASSLE